MAFKNLIVLESSTIRTAIENLEICENYLCG